MIFVLFRTGLIAPSNKISSPHNSKHFWNKFLRGLTSNIILHRFQKYLMPQANATEASDNQFSTLIHSDLWANNILVKYGDREKSMVEEVTFIDFQFVSYGSPAIDLYFFLFTSLQTELLSLEIIDEFVEFYCEYLTRFLFQLNYKNNVPNLEEFRLQFRSKYTYGK